MNKQQVYSHVLQLFKIKLMLPVFLLKSLELFFSLLLFQYLVFWFNIVELFSTPEQLRSHIFLSYIYPQDV